MLGILESVLKMLLMRVKLYHKQGRIFSIYIEDKTHVVLEVRAMSNCLLPRTDLDLVSFSA